MDYTQLKKKLLSMFQQEKLEKLPQEWGFYCESERDIKRLGYAASLTPEIIKSAALEQIDFLLTHHDSWEFLFGMKETCNRLLDEKNITHAFFHAPLDDADFGTSATLARALGLTNCEKAMPYGGLYYGGIIGDVPEVSLTIFAERLRTFLQEDIICYRNNNDPVKKAAVAAGGGNMTTEMRIAAEAGCDTYITGEYALYSQQYARYTGMNLMVGSHTNTEIPGVKSMAELLTDNTDVKIIRLSEPNY